MKRKENNMKRIENKGDLIPIKAFKEVTEFHGHVCPGSAIGYKAAEAGLNELKSSESSDEEIVAIVENDSCAVDAIQVVTGCTFGKGNLIFLDHGKQVYTFYNRETNDGVRIALKDSFSVDLLAPKLNQLRAKVHAGNATDLEKEDLKNMVQDVANEILEIPYNNMFEVEHVEMEAPSKAKLFKSVKCSKCGEMVSENRTELLNGDIVCIPCFKA
jgi:formylmethanofuran dehydrogenase subunit E